MRYLGLLGLAALLLFANGCNKSGDNLPWETNLEKALTDAKVKNKKVLVNFTGSDWCVWCKRLTKEVFSTSAFEEFSEENLILVKIDFPESIPQSPEVKAYNNQLAARFGIEGYPTIVVLDMNGKTLGVTGYLPGGPEKYIPHLQSMIN